MQSDKEDVIDQFVAMEGSDVHMIRNRLLGQLAGLLPLFLAATVLAQQPKNLEEAMSYDGLQKIDIKGIDMAYALPGATLSGYSKVMIDPIGVRFHKNWKPTVTGSTRKLSSSEQQRIRDDVAKVVYDSFVEELKKGGFSVVREPGPDVLRVQVAIINLYITAPDVMTPGRTRVYMVSAGEMTLLAELADSETGEIIARVLDRYQARTTGNFRLSSSVSNATEARSAASSWAKILRGELDKAKIIGG
jgi:hypothetical protein